MQSDMNISPQGRADSACGIKVSMAAFILLLLSTAKLCEDFHLANKNNIMIIYTK